MDFAPCVCVARDDRWGRTYESFGEDPRLVEQMRDRDRRLPGRRASRPDRVLATAKHYAGDGGTEYGTATGDYKIDQGVTVTSHEDFWRNALRQYVPAVQKHGVGTVMPSFSSVDWTDDDAGPLKMHAHSELITDVLKGKLGFDGFVISDWHGIHQIPGDLRRPRSHGVNAGIDMFMEPDQLPGLHPDADRRGEGRAACRESRIDDAVRRILRQKFELGLFEHPFADRRKIGQIGSQQHRARRPPGGRRVAGAAQEQAPHAAARASATTSTSPAATPTTSATRPAAGRSPGRAARPT